MSPHWRLLAALAAVAVLALAGRLPIFEEQSRSRRLDLALADLWRAREDQAHYDDQVLAIFEQIEVDERDLDTLEQCPWLLEHYQRITGRHWKLPPTHPAHQGDER